MNSYGSAKFEAANSERYHWLEDVRDAQGRRLGEPGYDSRTLFVPKDAAKKFTPFEGQVLLPLFNFLSKSLNAAVLVDQVSKLRRGLVL